MQNILITDEELKLADFGSCRGIYSKQPYTEYISTRWSAALRGIAQCQECFSCFKKFLRSKCQWR